MQTADVTTARGFILQATYRVTGPEHRRVPVVQLYGRYCNANKFAGEIDLLEALDLQRIGILMHSIYRGDALPFDRCPEIIRGRL